MTINSWLIGAVLYVAGFVFLHDATGTYLEHAQTPIYLLLAVALVVLIVNRVVKNGLLEISNLMFVVFFLMRIPFIYGDNVISDVYTRGDDLAAVPHALYILAYQFVVLSACILLASPGTRPIEIRTLKRAELKVILTFCGLVLAANVFYLIGFWTLGANNLPSAIAIALALFNYSSTLFLLVPCLLLIDNDIPRKLCWVLYAELSTVALCVLFTGSKSGVFQIILFFLIALLVIRGPSFAISARASLFAVLMGLAAGAFFFVGIAFNLYQRGQIDIAQMSVVVHRLVGDSSVAIGGISYRIGYLDFFIDKLTNSVYASSFSLASYFKAVVDAVTPGFDVFNQSLVSRAVYTAMFGDSLGPNSEAVTVFAEAHHLVGYFSFFVYTSVLLTIRVAAGLLRSQFDFARVIIAMFVAYAFQQYLSGFGLDYWSFGSVLYPLIFLTSAMAYLSRSGAMQTRAHVLPTLDKSEAGALA